MPLTKAPPPASIIPLSTISAAGGGKAFDELIEMALKLSNDDRAWVSRLQKVLKEAKQYIKGDYKVCWRVIL